jgi:hypothetical protein
MVAPPLPWHRQEDREFVVDLKRRSSGRLAIGLAPQFQEIHDYIERMAYEDFPDYAWIRGKLQELREIGEREEQLASMTNLGSLTEIGFSAEARPRSRTSAGADDSRRCCCLLL